MAIPIRYQQIDFVPPQPVRDAAALGLAWRQKHGRGGTAVGVARARDLSNGRAVSPETIKRMVSYFQRHARDLEAPAAQSHHPKYPSAGVIAWLLWGGWPGQKWASKILRQMERADRRAGK